VWSERIIRDQDEQLNTSDRSQLYCDINFDLKDWSLVKRIDPMTLTHQEPLPDNPLKKPPKSMNPPSL